MYIKINNSTNQQKKEACYDSLFPIYEEKECLFFHDFLYADDTVAISDSGKVDTALQVFD